ncbi:unnamed protein product [Diamesa hyperborea]
MEIEEGSKDFMAFKEPMLKDIWEEFNDQCEFCEMKMVEMNDVISQEFTQEHCLGDQKTIEKCSKDFYLMENYQKLLKKYEDLQEIHKYLNCVLENKKNSKIVITKDVEILGLPIKEQNEVLKQRLMEYSDIKGLSRKIIRELTPELEKYQERYNAAFLESQLQRSALDAYSTQDQRIEDQFNAEVDRIEKVVEIKLKKGNLIKKKFLIIDWKLTREVYPTIRDLEKRLSEAKKNTVDCEQEIEDLNARNEKMKTENESFSDLYKTLESEFKKITKDTKIGLYDIETLLKTIPKVKSEILKLKQSSEETITDLNETNDLKLHFIDEYNQSLMDLIEKQKITTTAELRTQDCLIHGLNCEVKHLNEKLTDSKIQIKILMEDIHNLTYVKKIVPVMGGDYMGSCFITYVEE